MFKRIKLVIVVLLLLATFGCVFKPAQNYISQNKLHFLTNDSVKYWSAAWNIDYFQPYVEGGFAIYKDGNFHEYQFNYENKRIITDNLSEDVICPPTKFSLKSNTFYLTRCGWTFRFKIINLTEDTLQLKELTDYNYFPDNIPITFIKSGDQVTRPVAGNLLQPDSTTWPVRAEPVNNK